MGDQFDPCECINILTHEQRMQRLISMLRDSQSACTDTECFTDATNLLSGPSTNGVTAPGADDTAQLSLMTFMIGWIVIAMILYLLRPGSWRRRTDTKKGHQNGPGGSGGNPRDGGDDPDHRFVM
ncbi:small integral membrane protein 14-like [Oppia nitens]|uniref:small integral membrane protein 14-like n=1 Tax=Oppia nitens TaxID=1686743 RepID=UPI0023DA1AAC|nr:small integral membrane protein 14-like [Oppia nitens]